MCGIVGFWRQKAAEIPPSVVVAEMANALVHRGPDGHGSWIDEREEVGLGHRRLAIVDLSATGAQPMQSASGRFIVVFNGEIYNFQEMRRELESLGAKFKGSSDTEVLLAGFEAWGIVPTIKRSIGMFAIALWDRLERRLFLSRDRLGKKPLYFGFVGGDFVFASELKAFWKYPGFRGDIDRDALTKYLRHNYVPSPYSIFVGIKKLLPGTIVEISRQGGALAVGEALRYWSIGDHSARPSSGKYGESEVVERLEALLQSAVSLRMIADVPLGAFLSGGIDSSLIVALMQQQSSQPVKTFSIGFHEADYDEAPFAKAVAEHLGTDHTETYMTASDALAVVPRLPHTFDEPFGDSSQIPALLVAHVARQQVTVALSGDGGDELFCGYSRYLRWRQVWSLLRFVPRFMTRAAGWTLSRTGGYSRVSSLKMRKFAEILAARNPRATYLRFLSHWTAPAEIVLGSVEPPSILTEPGGSEDLDEFTQEMMALDIQTYLPDDILVKVDRSSMAESLECRAPLLDHRVVEFAASLPVSAKLRGGITKWALREILHRYVPRHLVERPKKGFGVPIDSWLIGPLREWAEDLLSESRLKREGFFDPRPIRKLWLEHCAGVQLGHYYLWDVLMFESWLEEQRKKSQDAASTYGR